MFRVSIANLAEASASVRHSRPRRPGRLPAGPERLEPRQMLAADLIISEFMAANSGTIRDEDGTASDWIELHNRGTSAASLAGWHLTDNAARLDKWALPEVMLPAGGTLLVWASGKDRVDPGRPLHTNFSLAREGEFLALVDPAGGIVSEFSPAYPAQFQDVSFGFPTEAIRQEFITRATPVSVHLPRSDVLGTSWTAIDFAAGPDWLAGPGQAVGFAPRGPLQRLIQRPFGRMRGVNASAYIRIPFMAEAPVSSLTLRTRFDDGFVAYLNGQRVASQNAPAQLAWNSAATANRGNPAVLRWVEIDLSAVAHLIVPGQNVLAVHGLNASRVNPDFFFEATLHGETAIVDTAAGGRFFRTPTPGVPNVAGTRDTRPLVFDVANTAIVGTSEIVVTAAVTATGLPVDEVRLHYRVMFGPEFVVPMRDDGMGEDATAADGLFSGTIPAAVAAPGQMVRWYVTARGAGSQTGRYPEFADPASSQYLGGVVPDPAVASGLPIFELFVPNPAWYRTRRGPFSRAVTSGSFFYDGRFYDNVRINIRGQTSVAKRYVNPKFKLDFPTDNRFDFGDGRPRTGTINLDNVYQDPSAARLTLGAWVFREAGAYAQLVEPVHTRMNGQFYSLGIYSERYNQAFLRRNGLDDQGALYEAEGVWLGVDNLSPRAGHLGTVAGMAKKNREWEPGVADLRAFVAGISPANPHKAAFIFDNVDVPSVVNVLAGYAITRHFDRDTHNYWMYRDSDGTGEWSLLPYDLDSIWNRAREPVFGKRFSGHPFEGSRAIPTWPHPQGPHWNRLIDAFSTVPELRQMVLRRLRTLMDEILQPPDTPLAERRLEGMLAELSGQVRPEAVLDFARWGRRPSAWGPAVGFDAGLAQLAEAFQARRTYLYGLPIIPGPQAAAPPLAIGGYDLDPDSGDPRQGYVEVFNPGSEAVDVSGWRLSGAVEFTFAKGVVIPAGRSVFVARDVAAFRQRASGPTGGQRLFVQGGATIPAGSSATLEIIRPDGSLVDAAAVGAAQTVTLWNFQADGSGTDQALVGSGAVIPLGDVLFDGFRTGAGSSDPLQPGLAYQTTGYPAQAAGSGTAGFQFEISTLAFPPDLFSALEVSFDLRTSNTAGRWVRIDVTPDGGRSWSLGDPLRLGATANAGDRFHNAVTVRLEDPALLGNAEFAFRVVSVFSPEAFTEAASGTSFAAGTAYEVARNTTSTYGGGTWRFDMVSLSALPRRQRPG